MSHLCFANIFIVAQGLWLCLKSNDFFLCYVMYTLLIICSSYILNVQSVMLFWGLLYMLIGLQGYYVVV